MPTTVRSTSIARWRNCWASYWRSSPRAGPAGARTTHWWKEKNGAIVRQLIGYGHLPAEHAGALQKFYTAHLNPYLNFHRPCGFATVSFDARGKRQRQDKLNDYATPYQKFKSLPQAADYLKQGIRLESLDRLAKTMSDTEFAGKMSMAKAKLLRVSKIESPLPPPRFL
jgi:hypothetical protein